MWRKWIVQFGIWLARHGGWDEASIIAPYEQQIERLLEEAEQEASSKARVIDDLQARMATAATVSKPVFDRALQLTQDANTVLSGGEAKRHLVYAKLIKDFPATSKRDLALAIELALFHAPKEG